MTDHNITERPFHEHVVDLETAEFRSPSVAVVETVAELSGTDVEHLDPLYEYVNPDALDTLFDHSEGSQPNSLVSFRYHGYRIELVGGRELRVTPVEKVLAN